MSFPKFGYFWFSPSLATSKEVHTFISFYSFQLYMLLSDYFLFNVFLIWVTWISASRTCRLRIHTSACQFYPLSFTIFDPHFFHAYFTFSITNRSSFLSLLFQACRRNCTHWFVSKFLFCALNVFFVHDTIPFPPIFYIRA